MANIFITGATGFIGQHLITDLLAQNLNYKIVAAVREKSSALPNSVEQRVIGDFLKKTDWTEALEGCDYVVHMAALTSSGFASSYQENPLYSINTDTTEQIAKAASSAGVKRFIFLSSIKVLGETSAHPFTEEDEPNPQDEYACSKLEAEKKLMIITSNTDMEVVIIRAPLVYGPGVKGNFERFVKLATMGIPLPLGNIKNRRTMCAVQNLSNFIITALKHPTAANEIFNVADNESLSTSELLKLLASANGKNLMLLPYSGNMTKMILQLFAQKKIANRLFGSLEVDNKKAEENLGWIALFSIKECIKQV